MSPFVTGWFVNAPRLAKLESSMESELENLMIVEVQFELALLGWKSPPAIDPLFASA